jgi:hypothetical protein
VESRATQRKVMRNRPDIVIKMLSPGSANLTHVMAHPARLWKQASLSIGALLGNLEWGFVYREL